MNYSAIIFNSPYPFPSFRNEAWLLDEIEIHHKPFISLLADPEDEFWKKALGSMWFNRLEDDSIIILMKGDPEITEKKTYHLYLAIALSLEIKCFNYDAIHLKGLISDKKFQAPNSVSQLNIWKNPYWIDEEEVKDIIKLRTDTSNFKIQIKEMYNIVNFVHSQSCPVLYRESFRSLFASFFETSYIEFKIPNLVRSIESILALPKGKGEITFKIRINLYLEDQLSELKTRLKIDGNELITRIGNLFVIRNKLVHGSRFEQEIMNWHPKAEMTHEMARYEYLAETLSRLLFIKASKDTALLKTMNNRKSLENHWLQYERA